MNAPARLPQPVRRTRVRAALEAVSDELAALGEAATGQSISETARDDLLVVLAEVMNNIVLHAYGGTENGWIDISVNRTSDRLSVEMRDGGRPLPPALLEGREAPPIGDAFDDLPEGGFGWFIIHNLAQDMIYAREGGENRLSFTVPA